MSAAVADAALQGRDLLHIADLTAPELRSVLEPAHRIEAGEAAMRRLDGPRSVVFRQAGNRVYGEMALTMAP